MLSLFVLGIMITTELMYYVQQDGYKLKSIIKYLHIKIKENFLNIIMCSIIIFCMFLLNVKNIYFIIVYMIIQTSLWLWAGNQFEYVNKIKYTKRLIRQMIVMFLLLIIGACVLLHFEYYYIVILFPCYFVFIYFLLLLDIIILMPIEKAIGRYYLNKSKKKMHNNPNLIKIGITGSYGKTSTKEILKSILMEEYSVLSTPKSFNTPFGISKTVNESMRNSHQIFICEMGAKKVGEIKELCMLVGVDYGIVTSVGRQHLETFGNISNIYKTKKELPDCLCNKHCVFNLMNYYVSQMYREYLYDKIGIFIFQKRLKNVNIKFKIAKKENIHKMNMRNNNKTKFFEFVKANNVYAKNINITADCAKFDVWHNCSYLCTIRSELIGVHNVINMLLAISMAIMLNISPKSIVLGVSNVKTIKARFEKMTNNNGAIIINNGYNSNLDSAVYSLKALNLFDNKNKLVVTPGIVECGDMYKDNYNFGKLIGKYANEVIIVKKLNREAILEGLHSIGFKKSKIYTVDDFASAKNAIEKLPSDYVVLIENDLPDNYK